jgi:hypothetical protein
VAALAADSRPLLPDGPGGRERLLGPNLLADPLGQGRSLRVPAILRTSRSHRVTCSLMVLGGRLWDGRRPAAKPFGSTFRSPPGSRESAVLARQSTGVDRMRGDSRRAGRTRRSERQERVGEVGSGRGRPLRRLRPLPVLRSGGGVGLTNVVPDICCLRAGTRCITALAINYNVHSVTSRGFGHDPPALEGVCAPNIARIVRCEILLGDPPSHAPPFNGERRGRVAGTSLQPGPPVNHVVRIVTAIGM